MRNENLELRIKKRVKSLVKKAKSNPVFTFLFIAVFAVGIFFRAYNWNERIYVHSDNSLYVQIAKYALDNRSIPQIGVFPQAPFFTGPEWLWVLMIFYLLPFGILSPWLAMTFFSVLFIYLVFWVGREIGGKWLGLLAAFFTAISPGQVENSFSVWNTSADAFLILLATIFSIKFFKTKKVLWIFLVAFTISFAITVRFQMMITMPVILAALFCVRPKIKYFLAAILGFAIPLLPFLIFDLRFNWFEIRRFWDYTTIGQYRFYVPNRWLTYAGVWWPDVWGQALGGNKLIGGILIFLVSIFTVLSLKNFKKNSIYFLLAVPFVGEVIIFRYFRGERYIYYSLFAHGAILILSAYALFKTYKFNKLLGVILILVVSFFSLKLTFKTMNYREIPLSKIISLKQEIYSAYPTDSFDIYGCSFAGARIARPLALLIYGDGRENRGGVKIAVCEGEESFTWTPITAEDAGNANSFFAASNAATHSEAIEWWKQNPPK